MDKVKALTVMVTLTLVGGSYYLYSLNQNSEAAVKIESSNIHVEEGDPTDRITINGTISNTLNEDIEDIQIKATLLENTSKIAEYKTGTKSIDSNSKSNFEIPIIRKNESFSNYKLEIVNSTETGNN